MSEEARARIDQSCKDDVFDAITQELGRDIMGLARMAGDNARWTNLEPSWWDHASVFGALRAAVEAWLADLEQKLEFRSEEGAKIDPATLGNATAIQYAQLKKTMAKYAAEVEGKADQ